MRLLSRTHAVMVLLLCCLAATDSYAQPGGAPVYSRQRGMGDGGEGARGDGGRGGGVRDGGLPLAGHYPGYYGRRPFVAGSWYARPYPYHFDYYRQRYSVHPQPTDCPCAAAPSQD